METTTNFSRELGTEWGVSGNSASSSLGGDLGWDMVMNLPVNAVGSIGMNFSRIIGSTLALDAQLQAMESLEQGKIVLIDRYYYSTAAYQGALGFDPAKIIEDNEAFAPRPNLLFIIQGSLDESFRRIEKGRDSFSSFEKRDYLETVRSIFDTFTGDHIRRIDGDPPVEEVQQSLRQEVNILLGLKETS